MCCRQGLTNPRTREPTLGYPRSDVDEEKSWGESSLSTWTDDESEDGVGSHRGIFAVGTEAAAVGDTSVSASDTIGDGMESSDDKGRRHPPPAWLFPSDDVSGDPATAASAKAASASFFRAHVEQYWRTDRDASAGLPVPSSSLLAHIEATEHKAMPWLVYVGAEQAEGGVEVALIGGGST